MQNRRGSAPVRVELHRGARPLSCHTFQPEHHHFVRGTFWVTAVALGFCKADLGVVNGHARSTAVREQPSETPNPL